VSLEAAKRPYAQQDGAEDDDEEEDEFEVDNRIGHRRPMELAPHPR